MVYGKQIANIGPINFQIDDGSSHPSGWPNSSEAGNSLFNLVAVVDLPQTRVDRGNLTLNAATEAYDVERRESWDILKKLETYLQGKGYSFSHGFGHTWKGENGDHLHVEDQVSWLQVQKFPSEYGIPSEKDIDAMLAQLPTGPFKERFSESGKSELVAAFNSQASQILAEDVRTGLELIQQRTGEKAGSSFVRGGGNS